MLPGLRFLFAAIMLSMSMLVFGLGAAALLRAAHEEFATNPSWHATPETMFAQRGDATRPVLAMLRVDDTPAAAQPAPDSVPVAAPAEPAPVEAAVVEKVAALRPEDSPQPPETVSPQIPVEAPPAQSDAAPSPADTPAPPTSTIEAETAAVSSSAGEPAATSPVQTTPPEQANVPKPPDTGVAATRIATLGDAPVTIEPVVPSTKSDERTVKIKKRKQARRKDHRRRIALSRRVARQAPQPAANPFSQITNQ
jgi:hypothetical protein